MTRGRSAKRLALRPGRAVAPPDTSRYVLAELLARLECERDAVHAVALSGWRRAVGKHMTQMSVASRAVHFRPHHPEVAVDRRGDGLLERSAEARPAGAAFELRLGGKQRLPAAGARERSHAFFVVERACAGAFRAVLAQDVELVR